MIPDMIDLMFFFPLRFNLFYLPPLLFPLSPLWLVSEDFVYECCNICNPE